MIDFLAERYSGEVAPWDRKIAAIKTPSSSLVTDAAHHELVNAIDSGAVHNSSTG
jgi:hypothetical protein